ncbi:hypothetical protein BDV59DRAFT_78795 [Aspergillus ambiguus]|uniref:uncharacterized protein n=1 Tax=Aspergillus ambiguus TaxID=176160 RepID=UPI003CCDDD44
MTFQTTRERDQLLVPTKQPLAKAKAKLLKPTASRPADDPSSIPASTTHPATRATSVEYDFSKIPQPFLDPPLWENMKAVDRLRGDGSAAAADFEAREREELERRRSERDAEFGSMAVRGRKRAR